MNKSSQDGLMLEISHAVHRYGTFTALNDVSLVARAGEFLTILGESGSGKTTLLRLISGLEHPYAVEALKLDGVDVTRTPAHQRNCTTVFQHYALFPHMSVVENVEYGLKVRGVAPAERRSRALSALEIVRLANKHDRRIHQLSGGERQRVALARAFVPQPAILLLDEPLGALDEKLRIEMQIELMEIHRQLGMTFVYITHSQEEALTMSDRVILMTKGRIAQVGAPADLFDRPESRFVADFMGMENLLEGRLVEHGGEHVTVALDDTTVRGRLSRQGSAAVGSKVIVGMRAERISMGAEPPPDATLNSVRGTLRSSIYRGKYLDREIETTAGVLKARIWSSSSEFEGSGYAWWRPEDCVVMPA
ncbi:MAG: ABC transporter ATP-binding protein [Rhizobiaceae bacterium]|nr:ABC transporter ATP-binding protein [Rhizobiaceae bacterium]